MVGMAAPGFKPVRLFVLAATLQPQYGAQSETARRIYPANAKPSGRHETRPHLGAAGIRWDHLMERPVATTEGSPTDTDAFSVFLCAEDRRSWRTNA